MSHPLPVLQLPARASRPIVEVAFKANRRGWYTAELDDLRPGEWVVVEADRGEDLGRVRFVGPPAAHRCGAEPALQVRRRASPDDVAQLATLRADEARVRRIARELVARHGLAMKITDAEWRFDRARLFLYFTAETRVDFRALVGELARTFRTRVELRQIGAREEAARLGGVDVCGRPLCCSTWLRGIRPVSLQLAKDQGLALNPPQISGVCGRLLCCLTYEHDAYVEARRRFPRLGKTIVTAHGPERVVALDIWRERLTLSDAEGRRRTVSLAELKAEMARLPSPE